MILDVVGAVSEASIPLRYVCYKQVLDETLGILVKIARELNLAFEDLLVDCHRVVIIERIDTREHLICEDAECPPVDRLSVTFVKKYFGC